MGEAPRLNNLPRKMTTKDKERLFGSKFADADNILSDSAEDAKGSTARLQSFVGAIAICDLVKSTLGPMGMDKILMSTSGKDMKVTNDGATILKSVVVDNPAANVLINMSKVLSHDREYFSNMCVDAILRLKGSTQLEQIQIVQMTGGTLTDSYLEDGFILNKKIGVGQPKRF